MGDTSSLLGISDDPAVIFLDSAFKPLSYNQEALRALVRRNGGSASKLIEARVRELLSSLRSSNRTVSLFQSGTCLYNVRLLTLTANDSLPSSQPEYALLLERSDRSLFDVSVASNFFRLTPRERETLRFLMQGMTSKEIASHMGVSPHTVKAFLRLVMSKMQVSTRSGIIGKLISLSPPAR